MFSRSLLLLLVVVQLPTRIYLSLKFNRPYDDDDDTTTTGSSSSSSPLAKGIMYLDVLLVVS